MVCSSGFLGPDFFVERDRPFTVWKSYADRMEVSKQWNLTPGWIWVTLTRGPEYIDIKLSWAQNRQLRDHIKKWHREAKQREAMKKLEYAKRALDAQKV